VFYAFLEKVRLRKINECPTEATKEKPHVRKRKKKKT